MARYNKGANAERELIKMLFSAGFAVARIAGSGSNPLPAPDIIALKDGKCLAIECKAWKEGYLAIPLEQMRDLVGWGKKAGGEVFVAWKLPRKGWFFLKQADFNQSKKFFMVSSRKAMTVGKPFGVVSGQQSVLQVRNK